MSSNYSKGARGLITGLIKFIGDDPERPGLLETPARVLDAWCEWSQGYRQDPASMLKVFEDGAELCGDEMVIVRNIEFYSHCEHHMAPFFGVAHVAYIPDKKIVGLSKLARVVDAFARRLQVQERLTNQVANLIDDQLMPKGVGVMITAKHFCMCSRGVNKQASDTVTSALRGAIREDAAARSEFLRLCGGA
jgi:GTP cyclohydrolase I